MRYSAPCAFERMTHICVNQRRRCWYWNWVRFSSWTF